MGAVPLLVQELRAPGKGGCYCATGWLFVLRRWC